MATSLRNGFSTLLQGCRALSRGASLLTCQLAPGLTLSGARGMQSQSSLLSGAIVRSCLGSWSPAWNTGVAASQRLAAPATTPLLEQVRTKVRYSRNKGKPKSIRAVPARFYRLNWGIWIRTRAGRAKRLWKKTPDRRYRLRQHVFCNRTQSKLLDKMVTRFWRKPKHWVDDPYEPYHTRSNLDTYFPKKSRPFFP